MFLELGFIVLVIYVLIFFYLMVKYVYKVANYNERDIRKKLNKFILYSLGWLFYNAVLSYSGIIKNFELPPRFPLLVILPVFIFIFLFLKSENAKLYFQNLPKSVPIVYQGFRIFVELMIYAAFVRGILPVQTTFLTYNYEIYGGILFIIIAVLVFKLKILSERIAYLSNYLGIALLVIIVGIFLTSAFFPAVWGSEESQINIKFTELPFILLASVLMPSAVFMHFFSIKQFKYLKEN